MLRPLLITENYPPDRGGMAQSCDRIVRGLRATGLELDLVHLSARCHALRIEQQERGRLISCPVEEDPAHALNVLWNALQRCDVRPSHVLAFGGNLPLLCAPSFAAWWQVPLISLLRGNDFDAGVFSLRRGWVLRDALSRSAAVAVVSREHQHKVARLFPEQRVVYVPNGIDASDWGLLEMDREQARGFRAQHVAAGRRVIGLFGHLKQKKGGELFLDALVSSALAPRLHLLIVGEVEPSLRARLETLEPALTTSCLPFMDRWELLRWYAACDAVAIPSLYDGMPNVVLEAAALGIPVLASTVGGLADLLRSDNALTFAPGDVHACRRALELAVTLPELELQALGRTLQRTVLEQFDQHSEARRYRELLLSTVACDAVPGHEAQPNPTEN